MLIDSLRAFWGARWGGARTEPLAGAMTMTRLLLLLYHFRQLACSRLALLVDVLCFVMAVWVSPLCAQLPPLYDGFEDRAQWQVGASDGVPVTLRAVEGLAGQALCLDFDFVDVAGYASVYRALPIDFPPNYEFSFYVRGDVPVNNLEFKLIDASVLDAAGSGSRLRARRGVLDRSFCHRLARALTAHGELRVTASQYAAASSHTGTGSAAIPG